MIHFGYYPDAVESSISHDDSLVETVRQAAQRLNLKPGHLVVDAGCGIGGPGVWLAQTYHVRVHGITNVQLHADKATRLALESGLASNDATFSLGDYTQTDFPPDTYDAVMAIESACYATDKTAFLQEMLRLLKPGGRLSVLDAFRTNRGISVSDEKLMTSWLSGWGATDIDTIEEFADKAELVGFAQTKFEDLQRHFSPSHHRCYRSALYLTPVLSILTRFGLVSPVLHGYCRAARDAFLATKKGLCVQGIFSATKPH